MHVRGPGRHESHLSETPLLHEGPVPGAGDIRIITESGTHSRP